MSAPNPNDEKVKDVEAQIAKINELSDQLTSFAIRSKERLEDLTPAKTTSFNGFGIMMLDYRQTEDGNYEATRWITACFLPLIPLSVWKIRPRKYTNDHFGEKQSFYFIEKKGLTLSRILLPYLIVALGVLPFVLSYYFVDLNPVLKIIGRTIGDWAAVGVIILLIILVLVWIGFIFTRFHNAEKAYKN